MSSGWIKLHRSITEWEWYNDNNTFKVFIHCILKANRIPKQWQGITINVGNFVTSYNKLAVETHLSVQNVRTVLNKLIDTKELILKSTNRYSIITVCNYKRYQLSIKDEQQSINTPTNKQLTTTNNIKKKEIKTIVEYLNLKAEKEFRDTTDETIKHINARLTEGYSLEDFKAVINTKVKEWSNTDMAKFIRPNTLFTPSNFENYLQQSKDKPKYDSADSTRVQL